MITAWTWEPDWSRRMLERLEWRTDVLPAYRGEEQRRALRLGPRQAMEFDVTVEGDARRHMEAALWGWGAQVFAVPLWFDQLALEAPLSAGAEEIPLDPGLRQFAAGDMVMILGKTSRDHEVIEVASVSGSIDLATPTSRDWPACTRVFPARAARLDPNVAVPRFTGRVSSVRLRFEMVEPAAWTADAGATTYRGYPVFEVLANWAEEDPALELARKTLYLDAGMGPVNVVDEAQIPIPRLRGRFTLTSREEIDAWRRRLFALRGKHGAIWVPSWSEDLVPVALVASNANSIDVAWLGYTEYLWGDPNRRDIRIQLTDGRVLYRRITGAMEIEAGERLSIDEPLGVDVPPEGFALVSWLMLMRQESDAAEFAWWRGDVVDTATTFRGFRHGV